MITILDSVLSLVKRLVVSPRCNANICGAQRRAVDAVGLSGASGTQSLLHVRVLLSLDGRRFRATLDFVPRKISSHVRFFVSRKIPRHVRVHDT